VFTIPISLLLPHDKREVFAKKLIQLTFKSFVIIMWLLGVLRYKVEGFDKFEEAGQLVIANHPTLIDIVFLIAMIPNADCIVKSRLLSNPFMLGAIRFAGYIANDDPEAVIELSAQSLARGNNLIIFPEGTRSKRNEPLRLLRGAANIAVRTQHNLRPVIIDSDPLTLGKGEKWYWVPGKRVQYFMSVRDELHIRPYLLLERWKASRKLTEYLESYFSMESRWNERAGT
jgi:1-acyl-sn-glycerol-3-phosphate acyltransferase